MIRYQVAPVTSISPESVLIEHKKTFTFRGKEIKVYSPYRKENPKVLELDSSVDSVAEQNISDNKEVSHKNSTLKSLELF